MTKFRIFVHRDGPDYHSVKQTVLKAEELGFDSIWLVDHFFSFPQASNRDFLEVTSLMSALAATTSKIRIGALVLCNSYRHPSLLAKISATIDNISDGRLEFGFGAGWYEEEYRAYGYQFPKASIRIEQMGEALQIIKAMWTEENPSFEGKHYTISNAICAPKPVQSPHPPITIGGEGKKLLGVIAALADRWNFRGFNAGPEQFKIKNAELEEECRKIGRDPHSLERSVVGNVISGENEDKAINRAKEMAKRRNVPVEKILSAVFLGAPEQFASQIRKYVDLGASYFIFGGIDINNMEFVKNGLLKPSGF